MSVTQTPSLSTMATDPLRNFKWEVVFQPPSGASITMGFMTVSGLGINIDVIPYREGGMNTTTQKLPGQADFNPITFSKGVILGQDLDITWIKQLFTVMQGSGNQSAGTDFRYSATLNIIDHPVTTANAPVKMAFKIYKCWPTSIAWGDLDAGANQVLVSQMALAHEGLNITKASGPGSGEAAVNP